MTTGKLKIGSISLLTILLFAGCSNTEPSSATTEPGTWEPAVRAEIDNIIKYTPAEDMTQICGMIQENNFTTKEELQEHLEVIMARSYPLTDSLADYLGTSPEVAATIPPDTTVGGAIPIFVDAYTDYCYTPAS